MRRLTMSLAVFASLAAASPASTQTIFMGLGDLPGGQFASLPEAVSADGSTVVGMSTTAAGPEAFRWTLDGGIVGLGELPGGGFTREAFAVSADGSVVVGEGTGEAYRWTEADGPVGLGFLQGVSSSPRLDFEVNFVKTGTHYVWIRGYKTGGADDSIHVGLDDTAISTSDRISNLASNNQWLWTSTTMDGSSRATFSVGAPGGEK